MFWFVYNITRYAIFFINLFVFKIVYLLPNQRFKLLFIAFQFLSPLVKGKLLFLINKINRLARTIFLWQNAKYSSTYAWMNPPTQYFLTRSTHNIIKAISHIGIELVFKMWVKICENDNSKCNFLGEKCTWLPD